MSSTMTLCPDCRTIQKAGSVCSICGSKVKSPSLLVIVPQKKQGSNDAPEQSSSEPDQSTKRDDAA